MAWSIRAPRPFELVGILGGFDLMNLDGEHGLFSPESIDEMCRIADGFGLTVTARVPNLSHSTINLFLDRGVMGILGPHVETAEDAQALVDAYRFVPDGQRSWGGGRGNYYHSCGPQLLYLLAVKEVPRLRPQRWMGHTALDISPRSRDNKSEEP